MPFSKRNVSSGYLLLLVYLLVAGLLIALLINEKQAKTPPFSPSHVSADNINDPTLMSVHGEGFHPEIKAVLARSLVNEDALLWRQLVGAPTAAVDVAGGLGLVACYTNKLVSIDLRDKKDPKILGSIELPGTIRQIKIVDDVALLAMYRHEGFYLVDLKNPASLRVVKHVPMSGVVTAMVVDQSMVYFTDLYAGVGRINLLAENPVPEIILAMESPWRIALQDNRLVVGTVKGHVQLFNIGQDGVLVKAADLNYPQNVRGVAFADELLAIAFADGSLSLFGLSSWPRLKPLGQIKLPGSPLLLERVPGRAEFAVALVASGVALVDVSQSMSPTLSGVLKLPVTFKGMILQPQFLWGIGLNGLEMYSLDEIYDEGKSSPAIEAMLDGESYSLRSGFGHLYAYGNNRLLDLGETASTEKRSSSRFLAIAEEKSVGIYAQGVDGQAQRVGAFATGQAPRDARFLGDYLYILQASGLQIISAVQPDELVVTSELALEGDPRFFEVLDSGFLLVNTRGKGVLVVDVNDPQKPSLAASVQTPKHLELFSAVQDILIDGQRVYLSRDRGGVHVFDMSSPSRPELVQVIEAPGRARKMTLYDNLLLVGDDEAGLLIVDVENPERAVTVGSVPSPIRIDQIAHLKDGVVVSRHPGGTMKLSLPQRARDLEMVNKEELRVGVDKVEKGQYLYLYDEKHSRQIKIETL